MIVWTVFIVIVVFALILDLGVFNRKPHEIKTQRSGNLDKCLGNVCHPFFGNSLSFISE